MVDKLIERTRLLCMCCGAGHGVVVSGRAPLWQTLTLGGQLTGKQGERCGGVLLAAVSVCLEGQTRS